MTQHAFHGPLERIDDCLWRIPRSYKPEMRVDGGRRGRAGERDAAHDLCDAHLPYLRYEQQQGPLGLAVRKYVFMRRGIFASDAQRKPSQALTGQAKAEVEYLLARLARTDTRARLEG